VTRHRCLPSLPSLAAAPPPEGRRAATCTRIRPDRHTMSQRAKRVIDILLTRAKKKQRVEQFCRNLD